MAYPGLHSKSETDLPLKLILCSFYFSTNPSLHGGAADPLWEADPDSVLDMKPGSWEKFSSVARPSACLTFWISEPTPRSESVHVSCQTAHATSDSPNITVCIIRQLPAELVFIIWLTTRDNDYFSFPGKTNIAAFSFQHQRWCSLAFYQLKDLKKKC